MCYVIFRALIVSKTQDTNRIYSYWNLKFMNCYQIDRHKQNDSSAQYTYRNNYHILLQTSVCHYCSKLTLNLGCYIKC